MTRPSLGEILIVGDTLISDSVIIVIIVIVLIIVVIVVLEVE